jgi:hypothetical protein
MNRHEVTQLIAVLRTIWPEQIITEEMITAWTWAFDDVPYDLAEDAAKRWIKTGKFFPKPAELLKTISVQTVAPDLVPEAAWSEVEREARRVGYNRLPTFHNGRFLPAEQPTFSHPLIAEAVKAVTWELICTGDNTNGKIREQFVWALKRLTEAAITRRQTGDDAPALPTTNLRELGKGAAD